MGCLMFLRFASRRPPPYPFARVFRTTRYDFRGVWARHSSIVFGIWLWVKTWCHFGVGAPPTLEPIFVRVGMFTGGTIWLLTHGHLKVTIYLTRRALDLERGFAELDGRKKADLDSTELQRRGVVGNKRAVELNVVMHSYEYISIFSMFALRGRNSWT